MNNTLKINFKKQSILLGLFLVIFAGAFAQVKYSAKAISLVVSGTSTLHDWDMKSADGSFEGTFTFSAANAITAVTGISFTTNSTALKSGHGAMDKNAYKALKTDKVTAITFQAATATVSVVDASNYLVKAVGKLTIAGSTQNAEISATCKVNPDKSLSVMGSKKLSMKEFGMEPPTFMMGTIKTGNDVTLKFDLKLNK
jgi:polyisoprenoid-binding protein YceI